MRDKQTGELVAVKFIERGEKVRSCSRQQLLTTTLGLACSCHSQYLPYKLFTCLDRYSLNGPSAADPVVLLTKLYTAATSAALGLPGIEAHLDLCFLLFAD